QEPINFIRLRQDPPEDYRLGPRDLLGIYIEHFDGLSFIVGSSNGEELALFSWPSFECVATGDNPTVCYLVEQTKGKKVVFPDGLDVELRRKGWRPPHPPLRIS
ncbi:hypothetical protein LCGC14_2915660, partial [marine sediment metagenome]